MPNPNHAAAAAGVAVFAVLSLLLKRRRDRERLAAADARSMAVLKGRNSKMHTAESIRHGRSFAPRPTDVFIVTYPKCGTTWVSAMAHFLRTDDNSFGEITEVVPWDIMALDCAVPKRRDAFSLRGCAPRHLNDILANFESGD